LLISRIALLGHLIEQGVFGDIFMVEVDYLHRIWALKWYGSLEQSGTALMTAGCPEAFPRPK